VDPARELAQLRQRVRELLERALDERERLAVARDPVADQLEVQRERDELLLRPVVKVALESATRLEARLDDPRSRGAQLLDPRPQVRLQPLVVEREDGTRSRGPDELGTRVQLRVVDDRCQTRAVVLDRGPRAAGLGYGQLDRQSALVHEDGAIGQPVRDRKRVVADALRERVAYLPGPR
jgi:hypothetical protein